MAETKEKKATDPRQDAWDAYVANYIASNPEKGKAKKARGEFDTIPTSFQPK
jgi:hypothetical protein